MFMSRAGESYSMKRGILLAGLLGCFAGIAFGQTNLILNGGFESGYLPWQYTGSGEQIYSSGSQAGISAYDGMYYLSMGNVASQEQFFYQTVTYPTNLIAATLTFYYDVVSQNIIDSDDTLYALAITNTGVRTVFGISNANPTGGYNVFTVPLITYAGGGALSSSAGQTVTVEFSVQTGPNGDKTTFAIDDVSLMVGTTDDIPPNDEFTNRVFFPTNSVSDTGTATTTYATREPGEPDHGGNPGGKSVWWSWTAPTNGTVTIDTLGSSFITLLGVYTGSSVSSLTNVASADGFYDPRGTGTARVSFPVSPGTQYQIAVDGYNAGLGAESGHVNLTLTFQADKKAPSVSIVFPAAGARLTNSTVVARGTASDNVKVALVQYRLENADGTNDYQDATGTTNWTATVTNLIPGLDTLRVRAIDTSSNISATVAHTFSYVIVSPLTLVTNGNGSFVPNLNGKLLDVDTNYIVTAKPAPGYIFVDWNGDSALDEAKLEFRMQSNLVLTAEFIPNPFIPIAGPYQGLFSDTNVAQQSSGFFSGTLTSGGLLTAKIRPGTNVYSLSAQFNPYGAWSNVLAPRGMAPLSVQLQLDLSGTTLSGQISNGLWTAQLQANRLVYSQAQHAPQAGKYTLLIPGAPESDQQPGGDGYGTVTVGAAGTITFGASLPDGTKVSQSTFVSAEGQWPLYSAPSSSKGSLFGWLTFTNLPATDIDGVVNWIKQPEPSARFYPAGFTNQTALIASKYAFTNGVPVLDFSTGQVWLANGNVAAAFTNQVVLGANSKVSGTNKLSLAIMTGSGLFSGNVLPPGGKPIPIGGVVLQKQDFGGGFFLGTNQSGRVYFGP